jgi:uncharacterized protein (TIGR02996 family)
MLDNPALLRTIIDAPDDDVPRLVYADWLDDLIEHERAAFIRAQVAHERFLAPPVNPFAAGVGVLRLRLEHRRALLAPFLNRGLPFEPLAVAPPGFDDYYEGPALPVSIRFCRGFVEIINADVLTFIDRCLWDGGSVFDLMPLRHLALRRHGQTRNVPIRGLSWDGLYRLLGESGLARLETFDLSYLDLGDAGARALLDRCPHLTPRTRLVLRGNNITPPMRMELTERFGPSLDLPSPDDEDIPF